MTENERPRRIPAGLVKRLLIGRDPGKTLVRVIIIALVSFVTFKFILLPIKITGISMEPTCRDGSLNFVNALAYHFRSPQRGDVVAIAMTGRHVMLLKRIIGLPGERIAFSGGNLLVNGRRFPEPYLKNGYDWNMPEKAVGPGEYFVAGDNRGMPIWMHSLGRTPARKIIGPLLL